MIDRVADHIDATAPFMLEVRHLGGALAEAPAIANSVGHRDAQFNLFTSAYPGTDPVTAARAQRRVYDAVEPSSAGGPLRTFLPSDYPGAASCYEPATAALLSELKATWDPSDVFAYAPPI
jgi:hypothetical protein